MQHNHLDVGYCSKIGKRNAMEDEILISMNINISDPLCTSGQLSLLAVFDGHAGHECSKNAKLFIQDIITKNIKKYLNMSEALKQTFLELDNKCIKNISDDSGSTATIVIIDKIFDKYYVANVGDSRALLISKKPNISQNTDCTKDDFSANQLTIDHKPTEKNERIRIEKCGNFIEKDGTMLGSSISRALGDVDYKNFRGHKLIISEPSIKISEFDQNDHFLLLASDGLFDVLDNEKCKDYVIGYINYKKKKNQSYKLSSLCKMLINEAIYQQGSKDNVSLIIAGINKETTEE